MTEDEFLPVLPLGELGIGGKRACRIGDREIILCRTREGVFSLANTCTHAEARMSEGTLRGNRLICPLHGASFDVRDGRVLGGPAVVPLATYPTRVVNDVVCVAVGAHATKSP